VLWLNHGKDAMLDGYSTIRNTESTFSPFLFQPVELNTPWQGFYQICVNKTKNQTNRYSQFNTGEFWSSNEVNPQQVANQVGYRAPQAYYLPPSTKSSSVIAINHKDEKMNQ
jgi:hypothetical protein